MKLLVANFGNKDLFVTKIWSFVTVTKRVFFKCGQRVQNKCTFRGLCTGIKRGEQLTQCKLQER